MHQICLGAVRCHGRMPLKLKQAIRFILHARPYNTSVSVPACPYHTSRGYSLPSLPLVSKLGVPTKPPRYSSLCQRKPNKQIGVPTEKILLSMPDNIEDYHVQDEVLRYSLEDPEQFWRHQAEQLHWHKPFSSTIQLTQKTLRSGITHDSWEWFPDGEISTCYNCVDRHVLDGHGDSVAIYFDSPVTNTKEKYTYRQLLREVETLAGALMEQGIGKGDVVMLYSK